ncbi:putative isoaspartyl peptidase/L-asparaginase 2, partial [Mucuna pruriens]
MDSTAIIISNCYMTKHNDGQIPVPSNNELRSKNYQGLQGSYYLISSKTLDHFAIKKCQNLESKNKNEITSHGRNNGDQSCNGSFGRDNGKQRTKNSQGLQQNNKIKARVMKTIMVGNATKVSFILLVTLAIIIPCLKTGISYKISLDVYVPTLEDVTNEFNLYHSYKEKGMAGLTIMSNSGGMTYGFNCNGMFMGCATKDGFMKVKI